MQRNEVKAFRQRLVRNGFTDVCIWDECNGKYSVYCTTPDGERINKSMSVVQMNAVPKVIWFE